MSGLVHVVGLYDWGVIDELWMHFCHISTHLRHVGKHQIDGTMLSVSK